MRCSRPHTGRRIETPAGGCWRTRSPPLVARRIASAILAKWLAAARVRPIVAAVIGRSMAPPRPESGAGLAWAALLCAPIHAQRACQALRRPAPECDASRTGEPPEQPTGVAVPRQFRTVVVARPAARDRPDATMSRSAGRRRKKPVLLDGAVAYAGRGAPGGPPLSLELSAGGASCLRSVDHPPPWCRLLDGPCDPGSPAPAPARGRVARFFPLCPSTGGTGGHGCARGRPSCHPARSAPAPRIRARRDEPRTHQGR
jgi:hypothetical protein